MIRAIRANKNSFRTVEFRPGFNVVLADKTDKSSLKDSRNGAGKSLLLEILHFCLGGNPGVSLRKKVLRDWAFTVELEISGQPIAVTRSLDHAGKVEIEGNLPGLGLTATLINGEAVLKRADWNIWLGHKLFGLSNFGKTEPFAPTFRSLFPFFARSGREAFASPFRHHRNSKVGEQQISNAFLLGLGWEYAHRWQLLREREKLLTAFKEASASGVVQAVSGSVGELEADKVRLEQATNRTEDNLRNFRIHPEYEKIEQRASELTEQIHELSNRNVTDTNLLSHYRKSADAEGLIADTTQATQLLEEAYREAGVVLPGLVKKRLDDVKRFHHALVTGRRDFLASEMARLERECTARKLEILQMDGERASVMKVLETHGALGEFTRLQDLHQTSLAKLEEVKSRIGQLRELEQGRSQLRIEVETLRQTTRNDLDDRSSEREKAISLFNANSEALYNAPGNLIIEVKKGGYHFDVEIERAGATGIDNMKVFCYDLMLAQLWGEKPESPRLLVHDSPLFDGVDERQKAKAWRRAKAECEALGFQYICMVNTDDIPEDHLMAELNLRDEKWCRAVLTDQSDGCLLGMRF